MHNQLAFIFESNFKKSEEKRRKTNDFKIGKELFFEENLQFKKKVHRRTSERERIDKKTKRTRSRLRLSKNRRVCVNVVAEQSVKFE